MKYFLILWLAVVSSHVIAQQAVFSDKNAEVRKVSPFSAIKISGGIEVYLSQSENYSLAVSADDTEIRDHIKTELNNGTLIISYENSFFKRNTWNRKLRAYISFSSLERLEGSGASDFRIKGTLNVSSLAVKLSGASEIEGELKITDLALELSGASVVNLQGATENLKIRANGASDVKNYDLQTDNCIAKISGASDVRITVIKSISASASGASTLFYKGNPEKSDISAGGASTISQKN